MAGAAVRYLIFFITLFSFSCSTPFFTVIQRKNHPDNALYAVRTQFFYIKKVEREESSSSVILSMRKNTLRKTGEKVFSLFISYYGAVDFFITRVDLIVDGKVLPADIRVERSFHKKSYQLRYGDEAAVMLTPHMREQIFNAGTLAFTITGRQGMTWRIELSDNELAMMKNAFRELAVRE
jgi:hypothetical protein